MDGVQNIIKLGNALFQKHKNYVIRREKGDIPLNRTDFILKEIFGKLCSYKSIIEGYIGSCANKVEIIQDKGVVDKIHTCFKLVIQRFNDIDRIPKNPLKDKITAVLSNRKELLKIEDKFNSAITSEERMWLKFIYLEFEYKIIQILEQLNLYKNKYPLNKEINPLFKNYDRIKKDLKVKASILKGLMEKYPQNINEENICGMLHLYDKQEIWNELFGYKNTKELSIPCPECLSVEELENMHEQLVNEFSMELKHVLNRFEPQYFEERGSCGKGGGGAKDTRKDGGAEATDQGGWRADFDNFTNGCIDINQTKKAVTAEDIAKAELQAKQLLEAEVTEKKAEKPKNPTKDSKRNKKKKKTKGLQKTLATQKEQFPAEAASAFASEHRVTFEETVQKAMYGILPAGARFAEAKRVKRWDIKMLNAEYILDNPTLFPEYQGLTENQIHRQILLHSGNRLHRLLMDPELKEKYAKKVRGGFTMEAVLNLKNGGQNYGRFEFGVEEEPPKKVYHRGFKVHMWGRDFQNFAEINLENIPQKELAAEEEEEFTAVGGSTATVDEEGNIKVFLENHSVLASYTILPK